MVHLHYYLPIKRQTMAILFEWYENPVPNDQTDPKTIHARITLNGKVGTDEIRHKI